MIAMLIELRMTDILLFVFCPSRCVSEDAADCRDESYLLVPGEQWGYTPSAPPRNDLCRPGWLRTHAAGKNTTSFFPFSTITTTLNCLFLLLFATCLYIFKKIAIYSLTGLYASCCSYSESMLSFQCVHFCVCTIWRWSYCSCAYIQGDHVYAHVYHFGLCTINRKWGR